MRGPGNPRQVRGERKRWESDDYALEQVRHRHSHGQGINKVFRIRRPKTKGRPSGRPSLLLWEGSVPAPEIDRTGQVLRRTERATAPTRMLAAESTGC